MEEEKKIIEVIDAVRPYLMNDGGNIEFIKYEDNNVYIQLAGACVGCGMIDVTLNNVIGELIREVVPTVEEIINVE